MVDDGGNDDPGAPEAYRPPGKGGGSRKKRTPEEEAARSEAIRRSAEEIGEAVEEINERHALVLVGGGVLVVREHENEDGLIETQLITVEAFRTWFANRQYWTGGRDPERLGKIWIEHPARRQCAGLTFAPEGAPRGWYNLWRGFDVEPRAVPLERACPTFVDHLRVNVCREDDALYRWVVGWFAHMVQQPEERIGTALVMRGKMGSGKTKVGEVMGSLFSRHYILVDSERYITGQFNLHMMTCLLLQADEGFWAGDKATEGRLKGLITSAKHMIEKKGVDAVPIRNLVRLLITSNEGWVVPAGFEERRFAVLDVGDNALQNAAYFQKIDDEMDAGGRAALLHHLLSFDLSTVDLRAIPATAALTEQKIASMAPEDAWWFQRLRDGAPTGVMSDWPARVRCDHLYASYHHYAERLGVRRKLTEEQLAIHLRKRVPADYERGPVLRRERPWLSWTGEQGETIRRRVWCFLLPPLEACRAHFEALLRAEGQLDWGADDAPAAPEGDDGG